jgi:hypothetical protein
VNIMDLDRFWGVLDTVSRKNKIKHSSDCFPAVFYFEDSSAL